MQLPIVVLSLAIIVFGILPGIPLHVINSIETGFGLEALSVNIWGIASDTGTINMLNIFRKQTTTDIRILVAQPAGLAAEGNSGPSFYVQSSLPQMCDRIIHIIEIKPTILSQYKDRRSIVRID